MSHFLWELRPYFRQVAGQLVVGSAAGIVMNTAVVLPALLLGQAIDRVLALERGEADAASVAIAALAFVGGTLATEGPRVLKRWFLMTANARIRANLRADALRGVLGWPLGQLQQTPIGDFMARIIGDVEVLGVGVREFTIEIWDTVLFSLSLIVALLLIDSSLTVLALAPVPIAMLLAHATGRWVARRTTAAREASARLTAALQEELGGVRLSRLFGRGSASTGRIDGLSQRQVTANLATTRLRGSLQPIYSSLMVAGVLLVVWQGGERVVSGALSIGVFVAYLELYLRFVNRGYRVPQLINSIQSGAAAYARVQPLLAPARPVAGEPARASFRTDHVASLGPAAPIARRLAEGPLSVTLDRVTFRYPGAQAPALGPISLEIPAGSLIAITGPVGSGKSALARALLDLYPLDSGRILFAAQANGAPSGQIGYVPQDVALFSGTIGENVMLGSAYEPGADGLEPDCPATLPTVVSLSALDNDVRGFAAGLDTQIGELGARVSGGQRQRVALARALAASSPSWPGLLVLDDPFSAVDVETESSIIHALRTAFGPEAPLEQRATIVLCSHRLAAFPEADLVVVLEDGRIVEQGPHEALLKQDGLYARIYRAQLQAGPGGSESELRA